MFLRSRRRTRSPPFFLPPKSFRPFAYEACSVRCAVHAVHGALLALLADLLLLPGDGPLRSLAGPRVRLRVLPADGKPQNVPHALIRPDLDLPPDVLLHLTAELTFDLHVRVDPLTDPRDLLVGEVLDLGRRVDLRV